MAAAAAAVSQALLMVRPSGPVLTEGRHLARRTASSFHGRNLVALPESTRREGSEVWDVGSFGTPCLLHVMAQRHFGGIYSTVGVPAEAASGGGGGHARAVQLRHTRLSGGGARVTF